MDQEIFRDFDILGACPDQLTDEVAWKIGCATARYLPSLMTGFERGQPGSQWLCVGRDVRTHSEPLAAALAKGIRSTGIGVVDIGPIDTPQMYFAINHLGTCGGVQVTASSAPATHNGFKIFGRRGLVIGIDTGLKEIRHLATALPHTKGRASGPARQEDLIGPYREHVLQFLGPREKETRVVADASNGMAGRMIPLLFEDVAVEFAELNFEHEGKFRHSPDPMAARNLRQLKSMAKKQKCDFGVCFDGDASRLAVVDEKGNTVGGDLLTALLVPSFLVKKPRSAVVYDVRSSRVVMEEIIKHGGTPRRERIAHAYMQKAMRDSHAIFGGGLSGHFYYAENYSAESALITLVHLLNAIGGADQPMSKLIEALRRYPGSGELDFKVDNPLARMEDLARRYGDGQVDHLDGITVGFKEWWFNCQPSRTEPLLRMYVEAKSEDLLREKLAEIEEQLGGPV